MTGGVDRLFSTCFRFGEAKGGHVGAGPLTVCATQNVCACGEDPAANVFLWGRIPGIVCATYSCAQRFVSAGPIVCVGGHVCAGESLCDNVCAESCLLGFSGGDHRSLLGNVDLSHY